VNAIDQDNTDRCPRGVRCEACGREGNDLAVTTAELGPLGIACLTLCPSCRTSNVAPPVAVGTAVRLVVQHCEHLGITADEMAEALTKREGDR
jgi:hypothetical protein